MEQAYSANVEQQTHDTIPAFKLRTEHWVWLIAKYYHEKWLNILRFIGPERFAVDTIDAYA